MMEAATKTTKEMELELTELRRQLEEANDTIEAIRTGQVDALVVQRDEGHQLYTLKSADIAYRVFIENMTEGAITLNREGIILYCNSQFATMLGGPISQVIGAPLSNFIAKEDGDKFSTIFKDCWMADCKQELCLKTTSGTLPVTLSITTLKLEEGTSLSIIITDLSAQKATEQQLRTNNLQLAQMNHALEVSNHDLQQFASVASHDLQEPLRKIRMFGNLLADRCGSELSNDASRYLGKIADSADRMRTLIVDILNYSKLSAGNAPHSQVRLSALVQDLVEDFELLIAEKGAAVNVAADLPVVEGNTGQLRQVFQNIISNALKFAKDGCPCVVSITAQRLAQKSFDAEPQTNGPYCLLSIKDNGIGFEEKYLGNVFALFERLHTKDQYEGTGIGLAISKKIVEKHNGLITARSRPGQGAEFLILIPVKQNSTQP